MAIVLNNVLELMTNKISENARRFAEEEIGKSVNSLVLLNAETLLSSENITFEIVINQDPKIVCSFYVCVNRSYNICISVSFQSNVPDTFKYEFILYHINSQMEVKLLESLNLENVTKNSPYNFMNWLTVFSYNQVNGRKSFLEKNLVQNFVCLYFQIKRTDTIIMPLEVKILPNEMGQQFYSLLENKMFTDVKIICKDHEFFAHKVVLAARSPVFKAMFEHDLEESKKNEIKITDFESDVVEKMLHYIYTDRMENVEEESVKKLLAIADKYELKKLQLLCMNEVSKAVNNVSEALDVLLIAGKYNVTEFKERVGEFIQNNRHNLKDVSSKK